jgi:hypothetical protein
MQAFRALNQALGRCIRHRSDWGAVFLLDSRYALEKNINLLPKWIRNKAVVYTIFNSAKIALSLFVKNIMSKDTGHQDSERCLLIGRENINDCIDQTISISDSPNSFEDAENKTHTEERFVDLSEHIKLDLSKVILFNFSSGTATKIMLIFN